MLQLFSSLAPLHALFHSDQLQLLQQLAAAVAVSADVMAVMLDADGTCWGASAHRGK